MDPAEIVAGQVFSTTGLGEQLSLLDPTVSERVAAAFHTHPWIERVISVQKRWPARLVVDVIYREPVAMVRGIDGFYPVDRHGILLPARDFNARDVQTFPVIEQVTSAPAGRLGKTWATPLSPQLPAWQKCSCKTPTNLTAGGSC
jgi:hypothetical protein